MTKNIAYKTSEIGAYYGTHRRKWTEFYPSERTIFERLAEGGTTFASVLDVGCAAGGLGEALRERFGTLNRYTGIDINREATVAATSTVSDIPRRRFIAGDICDCGELQGQNFDLVTALSVADWNVDASGILAACWKHVRPKGHLVLSLRLTPLAGVCDMDRSFQRIWFAPTPPPPDVERAPYNVFNVQQAIVWLTRQTPPPAHVHIYGYWGTPSPQATTPYDRLVFSVVAMRKPAIGETVGKAIVETELPSDAFTTPFHES